ncbi:HDIG domain-containing protein [Candidatus Bathyarchaeota archaeon]|nr:HDIG domain-containing protein [Candidatus Bathyarchaeota archaeon]
MITREKAYGLIDQHIKNPNMRKHMIAVSAIMYSLAEELREDPMLWEVVGLLHDIDYEEVGNNMDHHGVKSAEILVGLLPKEGLHAIKAHNERTGVKPESHLDLALIAADAMSGLGIATALIMPNKKLAEVKIRSLKKKFKDKSFARTVDRNRIMYCTRIGIDYNDFLVISQGALQSVSRDLGL